MKKSIHGDKPHPSVATCLNNIGSVYHSRGDYSKALEYHEESLVLCDVYSIFEWYCGSVF